MATSIHGYDYNLAEGTATRRIDLAHEHSFYLGCVLVEPSLLRLSRRGHRQQTVEPRVMQVLSALFEGGGKVVGRDELIERCWAGRIVGENSINRVISILRRASQQIGKGSFEIETIPKVGYRLNSISVALVDEDEFQTPQTSSKSGAKARIGRRRIIGGLAAATVGGVAAAGLSLTAPAASGTLGRMTLSLLGVHVPTREARALYDAGMRAQYQGLSANNEQAELFFRRAAQADPEWADAWGSLAMSYRHLSEGQRHTRQWQLIDNARSAANRALELDPGNEEAIVALSLIRSPLGRWLEAEQEYARLLEQFPDSFVLRDHYARVLRDLGRFADAAKQTAIGVESQPLAPLLSVAHLSSLWGAERLQEAEAELERAYELFAKCHIVWYTRAAFLTYTGRASEAVGFTADEAGWPVDLPPFLFERRRLTAQAVLTRATGDIEAAMDAIDIYVQRCLSAFPFSIDPCWPVSFLSYIGEVDRAYDILESHYLWRGPLAPPAHAGRNTLSRRDTSLLFMPPLANVRRDPRFAGLLGEIGLTLQFRESGVWPRAWRRSS